MTFCDHRVRDRDQTRDSDKILRSIAFSASPACLSTLLPSAARQDGIHLDLRTDAPGRFYDTNAVPTPHPKVHDPRLMEALPTLAAREQGTLAAQAHPIRVSCARGDPSRDFDGMVYRKRCRRGAFTWLSSGARAEYVGDLQEETLEIEYFESVMPPQRMSTIPHEDWVSSVSCQLPG